jgi:glycosyltransferase involved in cell wall biosynthesis
MITGKSVQRHQCALASIRAFVAQTYPRKELLIVNDSEHPLLYDTEWSSSANIHELLVPCQDTLGDLRNLAIEYAVGDLIIQWDDDDLSAPNRIEAQLRRHRPGHAVLLTNEVHYDVQTQWGFANSAYKWIVRGFPGTVLHDRNVPWRYPSSKVGEDTEFVQNFQRIGKLICVENCPSMHIRLFHGWNTLSHRRIMVNPLTLGHGRELNVFERRTVASYISRYCNQPLSKIEGNCHVGIHDYLTGNLEHPVQSIVRQNGNGTFGTRRFRSGVRGIVPPL